MTLGKLLAEATGTFTMIFVGAGSILLSQRQMIPSWCVPFAWGLTIAAMIFAVGRISGAHFNPAVTLAFAAVHKIPASQIPVYWAGQFLGGLSAVGLLEAVKRI